MRRPYVRVKRALDVVLAAVALVLSAPIQLVIAALVRLNLGSPVLFKQERPGRDGKIFTMLKFRTMRDARGADDRLLPDEERLTKFGRFLRASSLDELPELFNVLKGCLLYTSPSPRDRTRYRMSSSA